MTLRNIPPYGLALSRADPSTKHGDAPPQIIRLDILRSQTNDIIQHIRKGKKAVLQTGKQAAIHYGGEKLALDVHTEQFPAEIYKRPSDKNGNLHFSGKLSLHLEIQKAGEAAQSADAALAALQSTLTSIKEDQANNGTTMLGLSRAGRNGTMVSMQSRRDLLSTTSSRPSSAFLNSALSPAMGPTSIPTLGGSNNPKDKIRLEAMRVATLHLLAGRPMTVDAVIQKIRAPREDCERLLDKIARDAPSAPTKKELKDKSYRELDVWKFRYPRREDRDDAIDRAVLAFDRMRIEKTDNLWQLLLKPEERGKGKSLSRLNFDKPAPAPKPLPTVTKVNASDTETNKSPPKKSTIQSKVGDKKDTKDLAAKSRGPSPAPAKRKQALTKGQSVKEGKFKSAERIEDSDEELSSIEVKAKQPLKRRDKEQPPLITKPRDRSQPAVTQKKPLHQPSTSSSSSASGNSEFSQTKASLKPPIHEGGSSLGSKKSPRPSHGSSPPKPSPLGSSPPANTNDFDSSSTTTKGTSQSSAPSTPPSGNELPLSKQKQKYSPIVGDKSRDIPQGRTSIKRKPEDNTGAPPAKRPQVNADHGRVMSGITPRLQDRPPLPRKISESERSSSPEKPVQARDEVLDKAKRFQVYYKKYKNLHDRVARIPDKDREDKDMKVFGRCTNG